MFAAAFLQCRCARSERSIEGERADPYTDRIVQRRNHSSLAQPPVSVVIATRNEAAAIEGCLDALGCQTYPRDRIEVVLADALSEDGTVERAAARAACLGLDLRIVSNPRRITPAGFNRGIEAARGRYILILGARARLDAGYISAAVDTLDQTGADAVGGVVRTVAGGPGPIARAVALAQRSPFGVGDAGYRYAQTARAADTVNYGVYRREVFERIGGFDESMQWVEDDELNYRLRAAGGRLRLEPSMRVDYRARPSLRGLWQQRFLWGQNKLKVARRHPRQMRLRHAVPALFVLALGGAAALWPLGGRLRLPLTGLLAAYGAASVVAAARLGRTHHWPAETLLLPAAFATMHLGYGCGMLVGLAQAFAGRRNPEATPAAAPPFEGGT
jgi:succinoglycan biosynthesis protein ExoA